MQVGEVVGLFEELAEGRAAMAIFCLLLGGEFGKGFFELGDEKQGIVAEAV